jgi:hypothetical protein
MREQNVSLANFNVVALDATLRASVGAKIIGVSTYGPDRPISVWLDDSATAGDEATVTSLTAAHDPVFLSADKVTIAADGEDEAIITVEAPKSGAASVTLLVADTPVPVTLTNGVGTVSVSSEDPASISVSVQNGDNRSLDVLVVEAE